MTLFSSDLKLHLLHNFQQQFLSEYFNVIFAIQNAFIFIFLLRYRGSKKKSRYFSIWYTVTEYCFDSTLPDVSVIQDFKLLNKLSLQSENKLLLHGFFFYKKIFSNDENDLCIVYKKWKMLFSKFPPSHRKSRSITRLHRLPGYTVQQPLQSIF